jgi:hypothetical protein
MPIVVESWVSGDSAQSILIVTVENRWDEKAGLRTGCGVGSQILDVLKAQIKRRPAMKKVSSVAATSSTSDAAQK